VIEVKPSILAEHDGPMLVVGLQQIHGKLLFCRAGRQIARIRGGSSGATPTFYGQADWSTPIPRAGCVRAREGCWLQPPETKMTTSVGLDGNRESLGPF